MSNKDIDGIRRAIRDPHMRGLFDAAYGAGWIASWKGSNHICLRAPRPNGHYRVIMSSTAVNGRAFENTRSYFRKGGLDV